MFTRVAAFAEPLLQVLARGRSQFREEEAGASLVTCPNYICIAAQRDISARKHAAEWNIGVDGHGLAGLNRKPLFANVDADTSQRTVTKFQVNDRLYLIT